MVIASFSGMFMEQRIHPYDQSLRRRELSSRRNDFDAALGFDEPTSLGAYTRSGPLYEGDDGMLFDFTPSYQPARRHSFPPRSLERILRQGDELLRMHDSRIMRSGNPPPPSQLPLELDPHIINNTSEFALQRRVPTNEPPPQPVPMALPLVARSLSSDSSTGFSSLASADTRSSRGVYDSISPQSPPNVSPVIACQPCRRRKVRCDSVRPSCSNCVRRKTPDDCVYDAAPRRRGPDKNPGTRHRPCKKRPESSAGDAQPTSGGGSSESMQ
ncbi:Zn(2)-C6 fungal-type domain-containing protein [Mycena indigotica]|uniref:Zn(2)-C6 fungal-type domain-containing protein n=1 Tax=Mycena indigotica TaxID=2126181 RepID=A0A8H6WC23_9AGAR|nr:Zn(2)-C6 fungal-type domain-containing protein [Mycena indigotica]KAF7309303.1 Zn(2)-C6 fungal-type domain-containing protein [Mycena indigotica]